MAASMQRNVALLKLSKLANIKICSCNMGFLSRLKILNKAKEIEKIKSESMKVVQQVETQPEDSMQTLKKRQGIEERRPYRPAGDVESQIQAIVEAIYGPSENWMATPLTNRMHKFDLITKAMLELDHDVSNMSLHEMRTVEDVVKYFQTEVGDKSRLEDLTKLDLPKNLHMNLDYIRFHPETDKIHDGLTAFPGQATKVPSIKYRKKYVGYDGGDPINDPESLKRHR
ncbi:hypothetical protein DPMN_015379 [Dreissena polymorpha]|uniref:Large ribosomal subunit protein mL50 n=1 Tax=Dreissena polymorpha TaxID=45954 RepID=A0A9D4S4D3_DREPO|nr:hypothetical protein DPMN_015379 [Dreissena polymorpha]